MPSKTPLARPREYFDQHPDPLLPGLGVWVLYVIGTLVSLYALIRLLLAHSVNVPDAAVGALYDLLVGTAILTIPLSIVALLVVAGIMHYWCKSGHLDSFGAALAVAGWSYAPEIIAIPINYLIAFIQFRGRTFDASDPQQFTGQFEALQTTSTIPDIVIALVVVGWSVYILAWGISSTHEVEIDEALVPALIIGVGSLLLRAAA